MPKPVRDKLQLGAGDSLELETSEGEILLRPIRGTAQMRRKGGIWVFRTSQPVTAASVDETIRQLREERGDSAIHAPEAKQQKRRKSR